MKRHSKLCALLALVLAALLTVACGTQEPYARHDEPVVQVTAEPAAEAEPAATAEPAAEPVEELPEGAVAVSTVDELLAALAPNATIVLREGEYDLTTASDYGTEDLRGCYSWELVMGGAQLNITGLRGLRLVGQGQVSLVTRPRYAEVLRFVDCWDIRLEGLTLGHTQGQGGCASGVLCLYACDDICLENCRLFGCGVLGVDATECDSVTLRGCRIDTCSSGAVFASACRDMRLEDCQICDCGFSQGSSGNALFCLDRCKAFALVNSEITGNRVEELLQSYWSDQVVMLGCRVEQNHFLNTVFTLQGRGVTVDKCSFRLRSSERYYGQGSSFAMTPAGEKLTGDDLDRMKLSRAEYDGPVEVKADQPERTETPDGRFEVRVSTAEEFLAAIAPDTTILLDAGVYDLSATAGYGGPGTDWYYWDSEYDGYTLKLMDVHGLTIAGAGKGETIITALPRYASVLRFQSCEDLTVRGITAGHSEAPGFCSGNVLDFIGCRNVALEDCGLYGCGVLGVWATGCSGLAVRTTDIYECTNGAAELSNCEEVSFEGCSIHDCDYNHIAIYACDMTWDGQLLSGGTHEFQGTEYLGELRYD